MSILHCRHKRNTSRSRWLTSHILKLNTKIMQKVKNGNVCKLYTCVFYFSHSNKSFGFYDKGLINIVFNALIIICNITTALTQMPQFSDYYCGKTMVDTVTIGFCFNLLSTLFCNTEVSSFLLMS